MSSIITKGLATQQRIPTMGYGLSVVVVTFEVGHIDWSSSQAVIICEVKQATIDFGSRVPTSTITDKNPRVAYSLRLAHIEWDATTLHTGDVYGADY